MSLPSDATSVTGHTGVYRRRDGELWIHAYVAGPDGRRRHVGPRKAEVQGPGRVALLSAELERERRVKAIRDGQYEIAVQEAWTVGAWFRHTWEKHPVTEGRQAAREHAFRAFLEPIADTRLDGISASDMARVWKSVEGAGYAPGTLRNMYGFINHGFRYAVKRQVIDRNPLEPVDVRLPDRVKLSRARLDGPTLGPLFDHMRETRRLWWIYVATLWATGMRPSEALKLHRGYYQSNHLCTSVYLPSAAVKTRDPRVVPLPDWLASLHAELMLRDPTSEWVFFSPRTPEKPYSLAEAERIWRLSCEAVGIPGGRGDYTLHSMRKAFVALASTLGIKRVTVQAIVGHEGSSVTDDYDGLFPEASLEAIATTSEYQKPYVFGLVEVLPNVHPQVNANHENSTDSGA